RHSHETIIAHSPADREQKPFIYNGFSPTVSRVLESLKGLPFWGDGDKVVFVWHERAICYRRKLRARRPQKGLCSLPVHRVSRARHHWLRAAPLNTGRGYRKIAPPAPFDH